MKTYSYEALTKDGSVVKGSMESGNERLVIDQIQGLGYYPLKISGADEGANLFSLFKTFENKVREKDVMSLSYQLSVLFEAGFPLDRSLSIMAELTEKKKLKEIIKELLSGVRSGKSFSDALSMFPETFPAFYINMVKAGEAGGFLEDALKRLSGYLEYSQKLKEDVRSALIYPSLLSLVGGAAVIVLLVFVVPRFTGIFSDMGKALPLSTLILLTVSSALKNYWWLIIALISAGVLSIRHYTIKSTAGKNYWERLKFRLPVLGRLYTELSVARFARTLGTLLQSGVPILNALQITSGSQEGRMADAINSIREGAKKGKRIAGLLKENDLFPAFAVHMAAVGEETGRLDEMLLKIADRYDSEARNTIKKLLSLLEPVMILFMGLVVGFIVIAMLLAIFSLNDLPF